MSPLIVVASLTPNDNSLSFNLIKKVDLWQWFYLFSIV